MEAMFEVSMANVSFKLGAPFGDSFGRR